MVILYRLFGKCIDPIFKGQDFLTLEDEVEECLWSSASYRTNIPRVLNRVRTDTVCVYSFSVTSSLSNTLHKCSVFFIKQSRQSNFSGLFC
jgi:hypothetical protein